MHVQIDRPLDVLRWAYRLLYLQLFIALIVVMGYWQVPFTLPFIASVVCLLLPVLFSRKEIFAQDDKEEE